MVLCFLELVPENAKKSRKTYITGIKVASRMAAIFPT
jgi:hypothetical protein